MTAASVTALQAFLVLLTVGIVLALVAHLAGFWRAPAPDVFVEHDPSKPGPTNQAERWENVRETVRSWHHDIPVFATLATLVVSGALLLPDVPPEWKTRVEREVLAIHRRGGLTTRNPNPQEGK